MVKVQYMNFNSHITDSIIWSFKDSREETFTRIYDRNLWGSAESFSGEGSELVHTRNLMTSLPTLLEKYRIKTFIDAPCGDFNWMQKTNIRYERYLGVDIVADLIEINNNNYSNKSTKFVQGDIIDFAFPAYDMIFCRDCLVHLSNRETTEALKNFKQCKIKYLLTTNFPDTENNEDIITGQFRKVNLTKAPFNFFEPMTSLHEEDDKFLSLWNLEDAVIL